MTETTPTPASAPARKTIRWLGIALGLSLAFNLFFGGYMIGRIIHAPHQFGGPHPGFHELARDLSPQGRAVVKEVAREKLRPLREEMAGMRQIRDRIHRLVVADEVDFEALDAAFAELRRHNDAIQNAIHAATIEVAKRLPAEERRKLHFGMTPRGYRDGDHHGDRMPGPPPEAY